jgi:methylated-DNA-[protein]-cysteine S-methyltransferase
MVAAIGSETDRLPVAPRIAGTDERASGMRRDQDSFSTCEQPSPAFYAAVMLQLRTRHGMIEIRLPDDAALARRVEAAARACLRGRAPTADLPLPSGTPFQRACWKAARTIPRGQTRTYAWLAQRAGSPKAVRAAAQAMRRNPWPLVIPCHRVVGVRDIGGYAGTRDPDSAQISLKNWLLAREG